MARHGKQETTAVTGSKAVVLSIVGGVLAVLLAAVVLLFHNGVFDAWLALLAPTAGSSADTTTTPSSSATTTTPTAPVVKVELPSSLCGVRMSPGVDFGKQGWDRQTLESEIGAFFDQLVLWEFNTVLLPLTEEGQAHYPSAVLPRSFDGSVDPIELVLTAAKSRKITVLGVLDLSITAGTFSPMKTDDVDKMAAVAREVAGYGLDAVLLTNYGVAYGAAKEEELFAAQTRYDEYFDFAEAAVTAAVKRMVGVLQDNHPAGRVGLLSEAIWAHDTSADGGSDTSDYYEDYIDGFANTRSWVKEGLFDFVMVKNYTSTEHQTVPFDHVLSWWDGLCTEAAVPLYMEQGSHQVGAGDNQGWVSPDQLSLQWLACSASVNWHGSVFSSYRALKADEGDAIRVLLETIRGQADIEYISNQLVVSSPDKNKITTNESAFTIRGSSDPNFPLLLNGKPLETTASHGLFALDVTLAPGENTYTFEHKGTTVTYTIDYTIEVLTSVSPSQDIRLKGGTEVVISAIARKGASVYAMIGDTKVLMKEVPLQSEEGAEIESDFINFSGPYTLPASKENELQALGKFTVYVDWNGHTDQLSGGQMTVESYTTTTTTTTITTTTTTNTTSSQGGGVSQATEVRNPELGGTVLSEGHIVSVTTDYAETLNGNELGDFSRPTNSWLPRYTTDVVKKSVHANGMDYYVLGSGRRVYASSVATYKNPGKLTANVLSPKGTSVTDAYTTITIGSNWNVPYNLSLGGQKYPYLTSQLEVQPNYYINEFTATYVDIAFYYTTDMSTIVDVTNSPLFTKAEPIKQGDVLILRLYLKEAGGLYGYNVNWMADGSIRFAFRHKTGVASAEKPLAGKTIVVDAGHGGEPGMGMSDYDVGAVGYIGSTPVYESRLTIDFALELRRQLVALGAEVVMTRTDNKSWVYIKEIRELTRATQPDLFISLHMDSAGASANGPTVFYFFEQSQPLAVDVFDAIYGAYTAEKETTRRGAKWSYYGVMRVHDCPALLIECGFISNPGDLELLVTADFREKFGKALANGVVTYFKD